MNYIVNSKFEQPNEIISQQEIFSKQVEKYIQRRGVVGVLSSFPAFIHDYYGYEKTVAVLNLEQVGVGNRLGISYGVTHPFIARYFNAANEKYIHREFSASPNSHITRPRTDGAVFMKAGYPCADLRASGIRGFYHDPRDDWQSITPEIMQDMAKLLYWVTIEMANAAQVR